MPVLGLAPEFDGATLDIAPGGGANQAALAACLGLGILEASRDGLSHDQRRFLDAVGLQARRAREGVFLWNIEPYDDVHEATARPGGPLRALYAVAAGFKPNWILHAHGFDEATRVVFFDYSARALHVRRFLVDHWDGADYPRFLPRVFEAFPDPPTFYQLWGGRGPRDVDPRDLRRMWRLELDRWGGERTFRAHWSRYRRLEHDYLDCDLMGDPSPLLERIGPEVPSAVWWSNAYFTVYGNWFHAPHERRRRFESWVRGLAARQPRITLYGADDNNMSINGIDAGRYRTAYDQELRDAYRPYRLDCREIRV
jgi:hypothetical protein